MRVLILFLLLVLKICFTSILAIETLEESELRDLDIFLQDDEYKQINRMKRTDGDIFQDDDVVDIPAISTNTDILSPVTTESISDENTTSSAVVTESSGEAITTNAPLITETPEVAAPILPAVQSVLASLESTIITDNITNAADNQTNIASKTAINLPEINPAELNATLNNVTHSADTSTGDISIPSSNATTINETIAGTNVTVNDVPKTINGTNLVPSTANATRTINGIDKDSAVTTNSTATNNGAETNKNVTATAKPASVESDPNTSQSGVSGGGVLITIIVLVVIAGLAAGGYVLYKRNRSGYDPVEVEDQDKELMEIKSDNGFGKPIKDDEVKIQDQLTPTQPLVAPRTFAVTPTIEKKFEEAQINENIENNEEITPNESLKKHDEY